MEELEKKHKERVRKELLKELILSSVATAGVLGIGLIAPNVIGGLKKLGLLPRPRQSEYVGRARKQLLSQGMLAQEDGAIYLTPKGEKLLASLSLRYSNRIIKPKKWDGKWRVLIFDIPEKRRRSRDLVRAHLVASGFVRAQDSVWIYPYPCEELVALIKAECRVGYDLLYMIVDSLENDVRFREQFKLPPPPHIKQKPVKIKGVAGAFLDTILPLPPSSL